MGSKFSNFKLDDFKVGDRIQHYSYATGTIINKVVLSMFVDGGKLLIRWDKPYRNKKTSYVYPTSVKKLENKKEIKISYTPTIKEIEDFQKNHFDNKSLVEQYDSLIYQFMSMEVINQLIDSLNEINNKITIREIHANRRTGIVLVIFMDDSYEKVYKQPGDDFDINVGVSLAIARHIAGSNNKLHKIIDDKVIYYDECEN